MSSPTDLNFGDADEGNESEPQPPAGAASLDISLFRPDQRGSVSRNRLFYLRDLRGKASRVDVQEEALEVASVDAPVSAEAAAVEGSEPTAAPAPAKKAKGKKAKGEKTAG